MDYSTEQSRQPWPSCGSCSTPAGRAEGWDGRGLKRVRERERVRCYVDGRRLARSRQDVERRRDGYGKNALFRFRQGYISQIKSLSSHVINWQGELTRCFGRGSPRRGRSAASAAAALVVLEEDNGAASLSAVLGASGPTGRGEVSASPDGENGIGAGRGKRRGRCDLKTV